MLKTRTCTSNHMCDFHRPFCEVAEKEDIQIFACFCKPKEILDHIVTALPEFHEAACMQ